MATDQQRRQKKLERKKAKRKAVHKDLIRQKQGGLAVEFARIANAPILDCLVADLVWEEGMGIILLSRELRNGQVAFANFLVDAYCLGVKNVHVDIRSKLAYRDDIRGYILEQGSYQEVSPSHLRKLVESVVEYARDLGFAPHKEYRIAKELFGNIDASACETEFEFGRDGEPCFIAGPHDSPERSRQIISILTESCGLDNFNYTTGMAPSQFDSLSVDSDVIDAEEWEEHDEDRDLD